MGISRTRGHGIQGYASGDTLDRVDTYMKRNDITTMNAFVSHCVIEELDREELAFQKAGKKVENKKKK